MIADRNQFRTVAVVLVAWLTGTTACVDTPVAPTQEMTTATTNPCLPTVGSQTIGGQLE